MDKYDIVIIGAGPAGLSAGIYTSRAGLKTLILEKMFAGGQVATIDMIENYPGVSGEIAGQDLADRIKKQAEHFGAKFETGEVKALARDGKGWKVEASDGVYSASGVILAGGAKPRKLGVKGEDGLTGKGVSYCAVCDGPLTRNKDVVVIGGGNTAATDAEHLTKFARSVTLIHRKDRLRATKIISDRLGDNPKVALKLNSVVDEIKGKDLVEGVRVKAVDGSFIEDIKCQFVFVLVGIEPNTGWLKGIVKLDDGGFIVADNEMRTSVEGIFACGDIISKHLRQVVTAAGDGAVAAYSAQVYVDELMGRAYK